MRHAADEHRRVLNDFYNIRVKSPYHGRTFCTTFDKHRFAIMLRNCPRSAHGEKPAQSYQGDAFSNNRCTSLLALRRERSFHEASRREFEWTIAKQVKLPYLYGKPDETRTFMTVPKYSVKNYAKIV